MNINEVLHVCNYAKFEWKKNFDIEFLLNQMCELIKKQFGEILDDVTIFDHRVLLRPKSKSIHK